MKKSRLPQLQYACSKDKLRPVMSHVLVTKEETVASDAHILVIHKTNNIFNTEFIAAMPEKFMVHYKNWADLCKSHVYISFDKELQSIIQHHEGYKIIIPVVIDENMKYPTYNAVLPDESNAEDIGSIGFNLSLLEPLRKAFFHPNETNTIKLKFFGQSRAILVTSPMTDTKAIIMPCTIAD